MKKLLALILVLSMILCLVSCGNSDKNSLKKITVVLDWTPNTNHTGLYAAKENGYFESLGLDVSIIQPPEDGTTALVASGKAEFGIDFQDSLVPAFLEDVPVTAVAAVLQHNTSGIISEKSKNILSPKDMQGKKYATWDLPIESAIIKYCVEKDGGNPSEVEFIPAYVEDIVTGLQHMVDSVWSFYGWDGMIAKTNGLDTNFFYFKDIDPVFDYYTPVIVANNAFLEENPDTAKAFLEGCKMGYDFCIQNPDKAADILLKADDSLDENVIRESQKYISEQYKADSDSWGFIDKSRWNSFYNWLVENELADKKLTDKDFFTNNYLKGN